MAVLITDVTSTLQKVILPYVRDNFNKVNKAFNLINRNEGVQYMNNAFHASIRTGRSAGVVNLATDNSSVLPSGDSLGQASVGVKIQTGAFDISKLVIDATQTTKGAIENELIRQADGVLNDFTKSANRQFYSDGYGVLAQVGAQGTTSVAVEMPDSDLDDTRPVDYYGTVNADMYPTKYIFPNAILGVGSGVIATGTVSSVTANTATGVGTITFTGAVVGSADQAIYLLDGSGAGAGSSEFHGMRLALSSDGAGTYAGLARSNPGWTAQVGTTAQTLTLDAMTDKYVSSLEFAQEGDRYAIFVNRKLYTKYGNLCTALRQTVNKTELMAGWTGLEFAAGAGKVGVYLDFDVPDGEVMIINLDSWTLCQVSDMNWMEDPSGNGGGLLRLSSTIKYQAVMHWFANLLCLAPGANGRLTQQKS